MTTPSESSALTDKQIVEKLVTDVLACEVVPQDHYWFSGAIFKEQSGYIRTRWNPLIDWEHWREVEEKIMADTAMWSRFCRHWHRLDRDNALGEYMKADLRSRCLAALRAVSSRS